MGRHPSDRHRPWRALAQLVRHHPGMMALALWLVACTVIVLAQLASVAGLFGPEGLRW